MTFSLIQIPNFIQTEYLGMTIAKNVLEVPVYMKDDNLKNNPFVKLISENISENPPCRFKIC